MIQSFLQRVVVVVWLQAHYDAFVDALTARLPADDVACLYIYPAAYLHVTGAWRIPLLCYHLVVVRAIRLACLLTVTWFVNLLLLPPTVQLPTFWPILLPTFP